MCAVHSVWCAAAHREVKGKLTVGVGFFSHHAGSGAEAQVITLGGKALPTEPSHWQWPAMHFIKHTVLGLIFDNPTASIPQAICFLVQGDDPGEFVIFTEACFLPQMLATHHAYPAAVSLQVLPRQLGCTHPHSQAPT